VRDLLGGWLESLRQMRRTSHLSLAPVPAAVEESEPTGLDRRVDIRLPPSDLPWLNRVRLKYGPTVSLLDISRGGAHIETEAHRLEPGSTVVLEIAGDGPVIAVPAEVVRCGVVGIVPHTIYRGGLAFKRAIDLPAQVASGLDATHGSWNPLREQARLSVALMRRFDDVASNAEGSGRLQTGPSSLRVGADALAAVLSMLDSPAAQLADASLPKELCRLFSTVTDGLAQNVTPDALLRTIADRIRRAVPTRTIRLVETKTETPPSTDALSFDVPAEDRVLVRLLIDTWPGATLLEWHFEYLKAAAHILGLVRQLKIRVAATSAARIVTFAPAPAPPPKDPPRLKVAPPPPPDPAPQDLPSGWHRVVVRYTDGRLLKGYSREFVVTSTLIQVWPSPTAPANTVISVPLAFLKAVFFVKDFEGDPGHPEGIVAARAHGRIIAVTFLDGETIVGTTLNYNPEAVGFFVRPIEENNNARIFVASAAIRHVQFPSALSAEQAAAGNRFNSEAWLHSASA
jgi:hypothetical protein